MKAVAIERKKMSKDKLDLFVTIIEKYIQNDYSITIVRDCKANFNHEPIINPKGKYGDVNIVETQLAQKIYGATAPFILKSPEKYKDYVPFYEDCQTTVQEHTKVISKRLNVRKKAS